MRRAEPKLSHEKNFAEAASAGASAASERRKTRESPRPIRSHMHALEVASGGLLIALGVLLVIGRFTLISNWLSFLNRFAL